MSFNWLNFWHLLNTLIFSTFSINLVRYIDIIQIGMASQKAMTENFDDIGIIAPGQ